MQRLTTYLATLTVLLVCSCAQQGSPTGGVKDTVGPKIIQSVPLNFSTNFSGNKIILEFDEFIKLNNIGNELTITPYLNTPPIVTLKGKKVSLTFSDTLDANTTYSINFGAGIKDITEGNSLDSNLFIISTGDYLDSLEMVGQVINAFDHTAGSEMLVMLYRDTKDSIPLLHKPTYFTRTNKKGYFKLGYLKEGIYRLVSIMDESKNYKYDAPNELIAFHSEFVNPAIDDTITMYAYKQKVFNQYVKKNVALDKQKLMIAMNEKLIRPEIEFVGEAKKDWYISELLKNNDTLLVWLLDSTLLDSCNLILRDTFGIIDTIEVNYSVPKKKRAHNLKFEVNQVKSSLDISKALILKWNFPIASTDFTKIEFREENEIRAIESIYMNDGGRRHSINWRWKENKKYTLTYFPGAVTDIYGKQNDTLKARFLSNSWHQYADFKLNLRLDSIGGTRYILQLLNETNHVVTENKISGHEVKLSYPHLLPTTFKLKLIVDRNKDGRWTEGNYLLGIQPESVIFNTGKVEIRHGWDIRE